MSCLFLNTLSFVFVVLSFGCLKLLRFDNKVDFLTLIFFVHISDQWDLHFYLKFSKIFARREVMELCKDIIPDGSQVTNICAVLQRSTYANTVLMLGLFVGLMLQVLIIYFVLQIFEGKFYKFTNMVMLVQGLHFNIICVLWWVLINGFHFLP